MIHHRKRLCTFALLATVLSPSLAGAQAAAKPVPAKTSAKTSAKTPAKAGPKPITLPDAYSGMAYNTTVNPGVPTLKSPAVCVPMPALPSWLKLDCTDGDFKFTGTVPAVASDAPVAAAMTVIDANNKQYAYKLTLTLRPVVETLPLGQAGKGAPAPAAPTQSDYDRMDLIQTTPIEEGALQVAGEIANLPAAAKLHLQIWAKPDGQQPFQMQLVNPSAPPATVPEVDLKSGAYAVQFQQGLAAGQSLQIVLVTDDGKAARSFKPVPLPSAIDIGAAKLNIEEPLAAGATTISGTLSSLPNPVVKPTAASGTAPPAYGNLPGIAVWLSDPTSGEWSQVLPAVGATPFQFLSVNPDSGSFTVTLPKPLIAGQHVRVDVVPPPRRSFKGIAAFDPPRKMRYGVAEFNPSLEALSKTLHVITDVSLSVPTISSTPFNEGTTVISGTATPAAAGVSTSVAVLLLDKTKLAMQSIDIATKALDPSKKALDPTKNGFTECLTADDLDNPKLEKFGHLLPLTSSSSNTLLGSVDASAGTYKVTLADALKQDDLIQVVQVLPAGANLPKDQLHKCSSPPQKVEYPYEFHRTSLTFVAGVVISNSSASSSTDANFSQASQFYAFNADHAWRLPGYDCVNGKQWGMNLNKEYGPCGSGSRGNPGWHSDVWYKPGISTAFEGRLTSIPVSSVAASPTMNSTSMPSSTSQSTTTLLTSQKVFRVETIAFLPWVVSHGPGDHPNGLFLAPLAKAGFDTIAGSAGSNNVILPGGTTGTLNYQSAYKFYSYGGRLGNMSLSASHDRAPVIEHYLDVTFGRYTNLQSYICHSMPASSAGSITASTPPNTCGTQYPSLVSPNTTLFDSRKQLYRLDLEGLVKISVPKTAVPFYIGFNANISQHTWQAEKIDHDYAPPDDIRILFGTKIDIGSLLTSFKLGAN